MKMKKLMVAALAAAITIGGTLPAYAAWKETGAEWKYQNEDGSYKTSTWFEEAGKKYHFDMNGNAQKGWFKEADKWYFFGYNGVMQTGLIKVDEKVYFMNDDGSLFVGTKKIDKTDYNFTEYGTTNGQPSIVASRTWAGNGNQTKLIDNGGGGSSSRSLTVNDVVKEEVNKIVAEALGTVSDTVSVGVTGNSVNVKSTPISATTTVSDSGLIGEAENAISSLFKNENVDKVTVAGRTYDRSKVENMDLHTVVDKIGYADKSVSEFLDFIKKTYPEISIETAQGSIVYTIK